MKKTKNKKEEEKRLNIIFSIYFALNSNFEINSKSEEKFLNILIEINKDFKIKIDELKNLKVE